jgi:hypothetical protein
MSTEARAADVFERIMTEQWATAAERMPGGARMPGVLAVALVVQVLVVAVWGGLVTVSLAATWSFLSRPDAPSSFARGAWVFPVLFLITAGMLIMSLRAFVRLLRAEPAPAASIMPAIGIVAMLLSGILIGSSSPYVGPFLGVLPVLPLVLLLIVHALLLRSPSVQEWFESAPPPVPPSRWSALVLVLTVLAAAFWVLGAARGSFGMLLISADQPLRILVVPFTLLGATANVLVLIAAARKHRLPREMAIAGSLLACLGVIMMSPGAFWFVALAVIPSILLWIPAHGSEAHGGA